MADMFLRRTLTGFAPADEQAEQTVRGFKVNQVYRAKVVKPRSYQHHKLIMALLTLTYRNLPEQINVSGEWVATADLWKSFDAFRRSIAIEAGHFEIVVTRDGEAHKIPGSLSYDALDEVDFTRVSSAMMSICASILDMSEPDLAGEVSRYADQSYGAVA